MQVELSNETNLSHETTEYYRLSPQQRLVWKLQPRQVLPNAQIILQIDGSLDIASLRTALAQVCGRHEVLRTTFHRVPGMILPLQAIQETGADDWRCQELEPLAPSDRADQAKALAETERQFPFDLEQGPVLRPLLLKVEPQKHLLVLTLPAISADRRSLRNLAHEFAFTFARQSSELQNDDCLQYAEYAGWQNDLLEAEDQHAQDGRAFWSKQTAEENAPMRLPSTPEKGDVNVFVPGILTFSLESSLLATLDHLAAQLEVPIEVFLETLWALLLCRFTDASALTLGHGCESRSYPELENALGLLAKTLPVSLRVDPLISLRLAVRGVAAAVSEAMGWEEYFNPENSAADGHASYRFEYEDWSERTLPGNISLYAVSACADTFDLGLGCRRDAAGLSLEFQFNRRRYAASDVRRLADCYLVLMRSAFAAPDAPIGSLDLLPEAERGQVLVEWNRTERQFPDVTALHHLFEAAVQHTPDAVALVCEDRQLTYAQLNTRANQLAHALMRQGLEPDTPVGLCLERSPEMIVGLLGILKAGGAYVPLDPALPAERLAWMLEDSGANLLVTTAALANVADNSSKTILLDRDAQHLALESAANPDSGVQSHHLAYIIYTSGSTGRPKGVAIEHRQLLNYVHGITERLGLPAQASYATVSTIAADLGNTSLFPSLCNGGCLHVISAERAMDPVGWRHYFSEHVIDCLKIVPSHLSALLGSGPIEAALLPRQALVLGGEASSWEFAERIIEAAPALRVFNHYGPTETTVGVLTYALGEKRGTAAVGSATVPLGRPLANSRIYLLSASLQPVPIGVAGEVTIGGDGVGRGYLNQPELTAERFVDDPFSSRPHARMYRTGDLARYLPDGNLEFLGRLDHQVKIRGFRIELGEIESVFCGHSSVQEALVVVREDGPGEKRLAAYVVGANGTLNTDDLREHLKSKLPGYMVPAAIVELKRLPLTPNGKVDRSALPAPEEVVQKQAYVGPGNVVEETLVKIWEDLLGVEKVSIHDNFFDLGGHSLLILRVYTALQQALDLDFAIVDLFTFPTIHALAQHLNGTQTEERDFAKVTARVEKQKEARQRAKRLSVQGETR